MTTTLTANETIDSAGTTTTAFGLSYAITSLFNVLLVVLKEAVPGVQNAMVAVTGHHWVTHGALDIIVFVLLGLVLARTSYAQMPAISLIKYVVGSTVVSLRQRPPCGRSALAPSHTPSQNCWDDDQ